MGFRYYVSLFAWLLLQLDSAFWSSEYVDSGLGVLVETVLVHVHVTDVNTIQVLVEDIITPK